MNSEVKNIFQKMKNILFWNYQKIAPQNKDNDNECYTENDIWSLLVIENIMIFYEDGCYEVKKLK